MIMYLPTQSNLCSGIKYYTREAACLLTRYDPVLLMFPTLKKKFERQKRFYGAETTTMQQAAAGDFKN
jgi:hypothetical protein